MKGLGIDILYINRLRMNKNFLEKVFTKTELDYCKSNKQHLATTFAAKEAVFKAFGTGWLDGKEVEIVRTECGPTVMLHGRMKEIANKKKIKNIWISLAYERDLVVAVVVLD